MSSFSRENVVVVSVLAALVALGSEALPVTGSQDPSKGDYRRYYADSERVGNSYYSSRADEYQDLTFSFKKKVEKTTNDEGEDTEEADRRRKLLERVAAAMRSGGFINKFVDVCSASPVACNALASVVEFSTNALETFGTVSSKGVAPRNIDRKETAATIRLSTSKEPVVGLLHRLTEALNIKAPSNEAADIDLKKPGLDVLHSILKVLPKRRLGQLESLLAESAPKNDPFQNDFPQITFAPLSSSSMNGAPPIITTDGPLTIESLDPATTAHLYPLGKQLPPSATRVFFGQVSKFHTVINVLQLLERTVLKSYPEIKVFRVQSHTNVAQNDRERGCAWVYVDSPRSAEILCSVLNQRAFFDVVVPPQQSVPHTRGNMTPKPRSVTGFWLLKSYADEDLLQGGTLAEATTSRHLEEQEFFKKFAADRVTAQKHCGGRNSRAASSGKSEFELWEGHDCPTYRPPFLSSSAIVVQMPTRAERTRTGVISRIPPPTAAAVSEEEPARRPVVKEVEQPPVYSFIHYVNQDRTRFRYDPYEEVKMMMKKSAKMLTPTATKPPSNPSTSAGNTDEDTSSETTTRRSPDSPELQVSPFPYVSLVTPNL